MLRSIVIVAALSGLPGCSTAKRERTPVPDAGGRSATARDAGGAGGASSDAEGAPAAQTIEVETFDCERDESAPGQPPQSGLVVAGIRGWRQGGPAGANWNADDLRCTIRVKTTCAGGDVDVVLRVGRVKVARKRAAISGRGSPVDVEFLLPFAKWKRNFDDQKPSRQPYDTAVFRAKATLRCLEPPDDSWPEWAEDMFTAGFAFGE